GDIQDEITNRVAHTLGLRLADIEARRAERRGTSADAMDYVMRGGALWQRPVSHDNYRAMAEMYGRELQLDEHLPNALLGLRMYCRRESWMDLVIPPRLTCGTP